MVRPVFIVCSIDQLMSYASLILGSNLVITTFAKPDQNSAQETEFQPAHLSFDDWDGPRDGFL